MAQLGCFCVGAPRWREWAGLTVWGSGTVGSPRSLQLAVKRSLLFLVQ